MSITWRWAEIAIFMHEISIFFCSVISMIFLYIYYTLDNVAKKYLIHISYMYRYHYIG
jgi:hypothetical protein